MGVFQLLAYKDERLLGWVGGALLILDFDLHSLCGIRGLYLQGQCLHKDSHLNLSMKGSKSKLQCTSEHLVIRATVLDKAARPDIFKEVLK